jgi:hypothetical protein
MASLTRQGLSNGCAQVAFAGVRPTAFYRIVTMGSVTGCNPVLQNAANGCI